MKKIRKKNKVITIIQKTQIYRAIKINLITGKQKNLHNRTMKLTSNDGEL